MRKRILLMIIASIMIISISGCKQEPQVEPINIKPQASNMKSICELAVMEVYYHNVAKYKEEDVEGVLLWKKDKHFWIEYSGIVKVGIDVSLLDISVNENSVEITIPNAKVLDYKVDQASLTEDAYIYAEDSVEGTAEDETKAFREAQIEMLKVASKDTVLLASAQQRAQKLLEEYIGTISEAVSKDYSIEWNYIEDNKSLLDDLDEEINNTNE